MMEVELFLFVVSLLFFASILTDRVSSRFGVPSLVLFLLVGMLFGADGLGITFDNAEAAQGVGSVALCVILFSGGMDTKLSDIRPVAKEGIILSTLGVLLMALFTGVSIWLLMKWTHAGTELALPTALLMAATMSSTDSASVFSILRGKGLRLRHHLRPLLELESGSNDPMAAVLTTTMISVVAAGGNPSVFLLILTVVMQLVIGALVGFLFGRFIVWMMNKVTIQNESLYPILVLTSCIFIFAVTSFLKGNSFLAVYIGGLVFGNRRFAHKRSTVNFFDGITWLCQLAMFLTLGLLVNPHELLDPNVLILGLTVSVVMILISRPLSVALALAPFRNLPFKARVFVCWVGLRGASPILFAIMCLAAGVPNARLVFNVVFLSTLVSLIVQGMSLGNVAKWLGVADTPKKKLGKVSSFDIDLPEEIKSVATEIHITPDMLQKGNLLMHLGLPQQTLAIMVKRREADGSERFFVPTGKSEMRIGDKLLVIGDNRDSLASMYREIKKEQTRRPDFLENPMEHLRPLWYNRLKPRLQIAGKHLAERFSRKKTS